MVHNQGALLFGPMLLFPTSVYWMSLDLRAVDLPRVAEWPPPFVESGPIGHLSALTRPFSSFCDLPIQFFSRFGAMRNRQRFLGPVLPSFPSVDRMVGQFWGPGKRLARGGTGAGPIWGVEGELMRWRILTEKCRTRCLLSPVFGLSFRGQCQNSAVSDLRRCHSAATPCS